MSRLLGHYENFPEVIHGVARLTHRISVRKLQEAILCTLYQLNQEIPRFSDIASLPSKCQVSFEFGVAEGTTFNYLDKEEVGRFQETIAKESLPIFDVFCVVRYHVVNKEKRVPLKFDYYLMRFTFYKNSVELQICHERGTQRLSLEDLIAFIIKRVNEELSQRRLKPLTRKYLRTL